VNSLTGYILVSSVTIVAFCLKSVRYSRHFSLFEHTYFETPGLKYRLDGDKPTIIHKIIPN